MVEIKIKFTPAAEAALAKWSQLPKTLPVAMARALARQNQLTVSYIQSKYLSFPKNGPTVLNGLRVVSNRLRGSVRATKPVLIGDGGVRATIGTNVKYAGVHEFGGTFTVTKKAGLVRLKTDRAGNLLRQGANGKLAIFAKKNAKRAKEVAHAGSTYTVTYPERMPIRRGIQDQTGAYSAALSAAILKELNA